MVCTFSSNAQYSWTSMQVSVSHLLIPKLGGLGTSAPDVGEELHDRCSLPELVQLPQVATVHDLLDLTHHALSNAWDLTCFLSAVRAIIAFLKHFAKTPPNLNN